MRYALEVSIHALLAECDKAGHPTGVQNQGFNPRTPCGVRLRFRHHGRQMSRFQSTHSLRSATYKLPHFHAGDTVSIHALLAECDDAEISSAQSNLAFQSTHSLRSATWPGNLDKTENVVSIHALLAECDNAASGMTTLEAVSIHALLAECDDAILPVLPALTGFNPRTPCGVRLFFTFCLHYYSLFQSTHSLRSATGISFIHDANYIVSIHALLAECDAGTVNPRWPLTGFNPRTPCGVRPDRSASSSLPSAFQSTHSLRSATGS